MRRRDVENPIPTYETLSVSIGLVQGRSILVCGLGVRRFRSPHHPAGEDNKMARRLEERGVSTHRAAAFLAVMLPVVALASALSPTPAQAQTVEQFYTGRQVKLFVGGGAGGGYDFYARVIAPYMSKHLPGNPNIVVQGM